MVISQGNLSRDELVGRTAVVTGGGGGIGYEAARALIWLGARVVIAEIQGPRGRRAAAALRREFGAGAVEAVRTDVGTARSVQHLAKRLRRQRRAVDIVINNATVAPLGAVADVGIHTWDRSYRVNLRGPVLLARAFVPEMVHSGRGVFVCVSSTGTAFMGPYECMKSAQVHLATTLDGELTGTGVAAFTIGPGYVPTDTASSSIPRLAALMGKPEAELREAIAPHTLSAEQAGAGFAAAVAMAERYAGQETSSVQALREIGVDAYGDSPTAGADRSPPPDPRAVRELARVVRTTLAEQSAGWQERSVFERQWLIRTFRRKAGMSVDEWLRALGVLEGSAAGTGGAAGAADVTGAAAPGGAAQAGAPVPPLEKLADYYRYLHEMARGYVKDPAQREEQLAIIDGWSRDVEELAGALRGSTSAPPTP